jgi:hypothetical protein
MSNSQLRGDRPGPAQPLDYTTLAGVSLIISGFANTLASAPLGLLAGFAPRLKALQDDIIRAMPDDVFIGETLIGAGVGPVLSEAAGAAQLQAMVTTTPIEAWAGPVAGASKIAASLGIPRSTLSSWQQAGAVVALLRGQRKYAYPLEQFVDARPTPGMADVLRLAPDARGAWLWLRQPNPALADTTPLAGLKSGRTAEVLAVATADLAIERDFR